MHPIFHIVVFLRYIMLEPMAFGHALAFDNGIKVQKHMQLTSVLTRLM